jgi:hypothetical protein
MNCAIVTITNGNNSTPAPIITTDSADLLALTETQPAQYSLKGCTCECLLSCTCYCKYLTVNRRLVERKALQMYKSHFHNAAKLNTRMRCAELVAFRSRPNMLLDINFLTAQCHSPSSNTEL